MVGFVKTAKDGLKKFWKFLKKDSWASFAITLLLAFIIIKFIFFPGLSLITGTALPLVIVESCSMYHSENGLENTFESPIYEEYGISIGDTGNWDFQNGFSKGDIIFVVGTKDIEVGDVIIFNGGWQHPLIHRVVEVGDNYTTKGDNNPAVYPFDENISKDQIIGKALFKVPFIGWAKLIFFEAGRSDDDRGLCK
jgi:signal peptidase I